jgi:hypothetical protein
MPRLDRGIQYSAALVACAHRAPQINALEYWVARSSRATTRFALLPGDDEDPPGIKKAGPMPAVFQKPALVWVPGRSEAPPGLENYFFFLALDFFAFFAFFAFLAIVSSQGLMD